MTLPLGRLALAAMLIALVAALLLAGPTACRRLRSLDAERRLAATQAGALRQSTADAVATVDAAGRRERETADLDRQNQREIHDASGANAAIDPAVHRAGLRGLCRRAAYRDGERCRLLGPAAD